MTVPEEHIGPESEKYWTEVDKGHGSQYSRPMIEVLDDRRHSVGSLASWDTDGWSWGGRPGMSNNTYIEDDD
jgi:hypothetical protein